jgi:hypothetical protein
MSDVRSHDFVGESGGSEYRVTDVPYPPAAISGPVGPMSPGPVTSCASPPRQIYRSPREQAQNCKKSCKSEPPRQDAKPAEIMSKDVLGGFGASSMNTLPEANVSGSATLPTFRETTYDVSPSHHPWHVRMRRADLLKKRSALTP